MDIAVSAFFDVYEAAADNVRVFLHIHELALLGVYHLRLVPVSKNDLNGALVAFALEMSIGLLGEVYGLGKVVIVPGEGFGTGVEGNTPAEFSAGSAEHFVEFAVVQIPGGEGPEDFFAVQFAGPLSGAFHRDDFVFRLGAVLSEYGKAAVCGAPYFLCGACTFAPEAPFSLDFRPVVETHVIELFASLGFGGKGRERQ